MANRKGWDNLSDGVRSRYEKHGITRDAYDTGASLQRARGHTSYSEKYEVRKYGGVKQVESLGGLDVIRAELNGIANIFGLQWFDGSMHPMEKEHLAKLWNQGFMKPGKSTDADKAARLEFLAIREDAYEGFDSEDWNDYRELYQSTFG